MQAALTDDGTLAIDFASTDDAERFFAEAREHVGFFVELSRQLEFRQRLTVRAVAPGGFEFELAAEAVQVFPVSGGFGTGFQLVDWSDERAAELERRLEGEEPELSESQLSPMFKIKNMNPTERFILATKASRVERQILIRDTSPQVLLGLLQHPRIEPKEVIEILKSNFATGAIMEHVARNHQWMQNPEIPALIAKCPKTPQPLAIQLLELLRTPDLRQMAKSSGLREGVRKGALKVYTKRIGKH